MFDARTPEHIGDIVKQTAPGSFLELHASGSPGTIAIWTIKAIIILAKEIALLKGK